MAAIHEPHQGCDFHAAIPRSRHTVWNRWARFVHNFLCNCFIPQEYSVAVLSCLQQNFLSRKRLEPGKSFDIWRFLAVLKPNKGKNISTCEGFDIGKFHLGGSTVFS